MGTITLDAHDETGLPTQATAIEWQLRIERIGGPGQSQLSKVLPEVRVEPVGGGGVATNGGAPAANVATYMCRALLPARRLPAADYACHVLLRGQPVAGSPYRLSVAAGAPCARRCGPASALLQGSF